MMGEARSLTPDAAAALVDERRQAWLASARSYGAHRRVCGFCQRRQPCGDLILREVDEAAAFTALTDALKEAP